MYYDAYPTPYSTSSYAPVLPASPPLGSGPTVYDTRKNVLWAPDALAATALDASDGVIDGKYFGTKIKTMKKKKGRIVYPGKPSEYGLPELEIPKDPYQLANVPPGGTVYIPQKDVILAPDAMTASQLDASDGVIDGKYFGTKIKVKRRKSLPNAGSTASSTVPLYRQPSQGAMYTSSTYDAEVSRRRYSYSGFGEASLPPPPVPRIPPTYQSPTSYTNAPTYMRSQTVAPFTAGSFAYGYAPTYRANPYSSLSVVSMPVTIPPAATYSAMQPSASFVNPSFLPASTGFGIASNIAMPGMFHTAGYPTPAYSMASYPTAGYPMAAYSTAAYPSPSATVLPSYTVAASGYNPFVGVQVPDISGAYAAVYPSVFA